MKTKEQINLLIENGFEETILKTICLQNYKIIELLEELVKKIN
ncbi:hypothetical protein [Brachyspira aalborgi]|jgi:hypothetical protein|nr:hypothetical protein [Brachyspira aalborgi]